MEFRESGEGEFVELGDVFAIVLGEERENVAAFVVPCADGGVACVWRWWR